MPLQFRENLYGEPNDFLNFDQVVSSGFVPQSKKFMLSRRNENENDGTVPCGALHLTP